VVGDSADGFPGVKGWGAKGAAGVLSRYPHLEEIPKDWRAWDAGIRSGRKLAEALFGAWDDALLFRRLATLRVDAPVFDAVEELRWNGPRGEFEGLCGRIRAEGILRRAVAAGKKVS